MRYLTRQFAIGALRRGSGIEQFLGGAEVDGVAAVRWVGVSPMGGQYRISLHTVRDLDDDRFGDLAGSRHWTRWTRSTSARVANSGAVLTRKRRSRLPNGSPARRRIGG